MRQMVFILICVFSVISGSFTFLLGKEPPGKILDPKLYGSAGSHQIAQGNKLIQKGNHIWQEAEDLTGAIELLKEEYRFGKANKLGKKQERLLLEAAGYFRDGHKKQYRFLTRELKESVENTDLDEAREALMNGKGLFKKARRVRLKAENQLDGNNQVPMLYESVNLESQALTKMAQALDLAQAEPLIAIAIEPEVPDSIILQETPVAESEVVVTAQAEVLTTAKEPDARIIIPAPVPSLADPMATVSPIVVSAPALAPEALSPPVVKADTEEINSSVFFSVQILADRKEISSVAIENVYQGNLPVIHMEGDGWHRYMVGRFQSLAEARKVMTDEGLKGFIVAYNGDKRITVQEALEWFKN